MSLTRAWVESIRLPAETCDASKAFFNEAASLFLVRQSAMQFKCVAGKAATLLQLGSAHTSPFRELTRQRGCKQDINRTIWLQGTSAPDRAASYEELTPSSPVLVAPVGPIEEPSRGRHAAKGRRLGLLSAGGDIIKVWGTPACSLV